MMPNAKDEPLIYTSKGNLPISSLEYKYGWDEDHRALVFWEEYWLKGELVKRAAHVRTKHGMTAEGAAGDFPK